MRRSIDILRLHCISNALCYMMLHTLFQPGSMCWAQCYVQAFRLVRKSPQTSKNMYWLKIDTWYHTSTLPGWGSGSRCRSGSGSRLWVGDPRTWQHAYSGVPPGLITSSSHPFIENTELLHAAKPVIAIKRARTTICPGTLHATVVRTSGPAYTHTASVVWYEDNGQLV